MATRRPQAVLSATLPLLAGLVLLPGCAPAPEVGSAAPGVPTWAQDVAPILWQNCSGCHRPGSVAPFALLTAEDARRRSRQIAEITASGTMPPWLPDRGFVDLEGERGLDAEEIATLGRWAAAGAPLGDTRHLPDPPRFAEGWELGEPSLVATMPRSFRLPAVGADIYRNFVVPLPLPAGTRIAAVEFRPGNPRVVHHAAVLADATGTAARLEALDPRPGYEDMVGGVAPGGHFLGWTPGRRASRLPAGMPWTVEEGTVLVFQLHLLPSGREEEVQASVGIYLSDESPRKVPTSLHLLTTDLDIPAGAVSYVAADAMRVPVDVEIYAAYPHAHYLGTRVEARAELPDGSALPLLRISRWDFNWQDEYRYRAPLALPAGATVRLELTYDNSGANPRNPSVPPRRVIWGPSSRDEMGDLWLKVVPRDPADLAVLEEAVAHHTAERYRQGYRRRAEADPTDADAWSRLGIGLVQEGSYEEAVRCLERALELRSATWDLQQNLGVAKAALGRREEARGHFLAALELQPGDSKTHNELGTLALARGEVAAAVDHFREAVAGRPRNADLRANLGLALLRGGRVAEGEVELRRAIELEPRNAEARLNYGTLLAASGRGDAAAAQFESALELDPSSVEAAKNLARTQLRAGRAGSAVVTLQQAAVQHPEDPEVFHFLGLAQAQAQDLESAIRAVRRALEIDPGRGLARSDLGFFLILAGHPGEGLRELDRATGLSRESMADAHFRRGLALESLGQPEKAAEEAELALRLDPGHAEAADLRRRVANR